MPQRGDNDARGTDSKMPLGVPPLQVPSVADEFLSFGIGEPQNKAAASARWVSLCAGVLTISSTILVAASKSETVLTCGLPLTTSRSVAMPSVGLEAQVLGVVVVGAPETAVLSSDCWRVCCCVKYGCC